MNMNGKVKKTLSILLKGLKYFSFGLVTSIATATLTYFIAPGSNSKGPNRIDDNDNTLQTHGDLLFSNISALKKLTLKNLSADVTLPDNDSSEKTNNHISLSGNVSLSMPSLSELSLNLDTTLSYDGYSSANPVKKDLDVTYLGEEKNLYLSLTDGYVDENGNKKTIVYEGNPYTSGIRYCVSGTEYDDLIDTVYTMLEESARFSSYMKDEDDSNSSSGDSSLSELMNKLSMSLVEDENKSYEYTFTIDLGKDDWDPIVLKMSSDEECNLTGVWTNDPIKIPLDAKNNKYCLISLNAKETSMTETTEILPPKDKDSYSHLINSTSLMKKVFNIVDKESFDLDMSGKLIHKYDEKDVSSDEVAQKENLYETLTLGAKLSIDYPNNLLDFSPILTSKFDGEDSSYSYDLDMSLRSSEDKSNLYLSYNVNESPLAKLNFTNVKTIDKFLGSIINSSSNIVSNLDTQKLMNVVNYFTSIVTDTKEIITGKATLEGNGEPSSDIGNVGDIYLNKDNNRKYTKDENGWKENSLTLIDEIKEGHYQRCFEILKGIYTGDNVISIVLTLAPFGLGENATIALTLDGNDTSPNKDLASIALGELEFSDFKLKDFVIRVNEVKKEFFSVDEASFQKVNNMPAMFDELMTIADAKKAGLVFSGSLSNKIASNSKSLSSFSFSGAAKFDANAGNQGAKLFLDMEQIYANEPKKNVRHDLRLEMGRLINQEETRDENGTVLTPEEHDYLTKFSYQSKDAEEQNGNERGGLYGKGYISSISDLLKYLRTLLSDEKTTLRDRVISPIRSLVTMVNLSNINENTGSNSASSNRRYFDFLKTSYISSISNDASDGFENLTIVLNGKAFDLNSDIKFVMKRYLNDSGNHKAGELASFNLVDLWLSESKTLDLTFNIERYEDVATKECPLDKADSQNEDAKNYYDFSSLATLAKFGINTSLKQDSYYWSGDVSVNLGALVGIISVKANIYLKVNGSSFKMMGDFSLPLIPDVNGPTENVTDLLREMSGFGSRNVNFYYDANTDYESNASCSRVYFSGLSDTKGNAFDTKDYASFDIDYLLNHTEDVFLGYVLDVYPSLLKNRNGQEQDSNGEAEGSSSSDITLDNEYDSLIKEYYAPEAGENGSYGITFDLASLLGIMSVRSSSFDFDMNVRHLADVTLEITTKDDVLACFYADIKIYLGIRVTISLANNDPEKIDDNVSMFHNKIADSKFSSDGEFYSYINEHCGDSINTVYIAKKTKSDNGYLWNDAYSIDESWKLAA